MGIRADFDMRGIQEYINSKIELLHMVVRRDLNYLGMECIGVARRLDTYMDRTSNLRNSIGYIITYNGEIIESMFPNDTQGTENGKGKQKGEEFAKEIASNFPRNYSLIIVAGMEYASYVEDIRHYEVLEPAKAYARIKEREVAEKIMKSFKRIARR